MSDQESETGDKKPIVIKNATDLQRLKLEKLMKNPEKPVVIPDTPKQKSLAPPPDFVRNVMGSSAGAGSGEFHVYRHLRRKEYARQKFIQEKSEKASASGGVPYELENSFDSDNIQSKESGTNEEPNMMALSPIVEVKQCEDFQPQTSTDNIGTATYVEKSPASRKASDFVRREGALRLKILEEKRKIEVEMLKVQEKLDEEYRARIEQNRIAAEERTAKKRAKRLKKKKNAKLKGKKPKLDTMQKSSSQSDNSSDDEDSEVKGQDSEEPQECDNKEEKKQS